MCVGCCCCCCCCCGGVCAWQIGNGKMAVVPNHSSKNKLKMGNASRYYGSYLVYDAANSCLAALHARIASPVVTRTNPSSPVRVQNSRKSSSLSLFSIFRQGCSVSRQRLTRLCSNAWQDFTTVPQLSRK